MAEKTASAVWNGNLTEGSGEVSTASHVLNDVGLTWKARTSDNNETSPEELIAAAHAACYAMALSNALATAGTPAKKIAVTATVGFNVGAGGAKITHSKLKVTGTVPGLDQAGFEKAAREGEKGCPVSNALRNNVDISVDATLA
jgi:osmotically inducible protein OsmC